VINVGVFNSGLLAEETPRGGLPYEYEEAPTELVARASAIAAACRRHGTSLPAAALAFAAAHPAVATVVVGAQSPGQARRNAELASAPPPPAALWADLVAGGLLRPDAPVPGSDLEQGETRGRHRRGDREDQGDDRGGRSPTGRPAAAGG
jgi:D-threo-aldose 1-dehydrogenase